MYGVSDRDRDVFERVRAGYTLACEKGDPKLIARAVAEDIGLADPRTGRHFRGEDGAPRLAPAKDRKRRVADYPIHAVSEAILGPNWLGQLCGGNRRVWEEQAAPIGPSFFANVSAWTATIGGLVQGQILEGYETSDFDLVDLFPTRPVTFWQGGERYTSIIGPSRPAPKVGPGQSHPDARMDALWVEPGPMAKYGLKLIVARETAEVDLTGGRILAAARDLGTALRYRENELTLDVLVGQTNNFKLGLTSDAAATGYNTYGATVPTGLGTTGTLNNSIVNPMTDPESTFNASQESLVGYKHPVTGLPMPMAQRLSTLVVPSNLQWFAGFVTSVGQITVGAQPASPGPGTLGGSSGFPTGWMTGTNPFAGLFKRVIVSQWLYNRLTASTTQTDQDLSPGLGLTVANSRRWWRLDPDRFACRRMAWDVTVNEISPQSFPMLDQGIIFGAVGSIAVQVQVLSPWAAQMNKVV